MANNFPTLDEGKIRIAFGDISYKDVDNDTITLNTLNRSMDENLVISSNNVTRGTIKYGDNIYDFQGTLSQPKTINCKNKIMGYNIQITSGSFKDCIVLYSEEQFSISSHNKLSVATMSKTWPGVIYYSYDGINWPAGQQWGGTTALSSSTTKVNNKYYLYLRGKNNTVLTGTAFNTTPCWKLATSNAYIYCEGSLKYLLDYENPPTELTNNHAFSYLFYQWSNLRTCPSLSFTTVSQNCYYHMFDGCTSLITLPALPAQTTSTNCYYYMFNECSLIKLSNIQTGDYQTPYYLPTATGSNPMYGMFRNTGGTFTGTPTGNTTYYTSNTVIS